jgi:subtilisin family serine protease
MAGRLLSSLAFALSALGVSGLPQSAKSDGFYLGVPISNPDAQNLIPHKYIVVYNNTFNDDDIVAHQESIIKTISTRNINKRSPLTGQLLSTAVKSFKVGAWRAMSLEADDLMINEIFSSNEVEYIEQDAYVNLNARAMQAQAPSGLVRLSHARAGSGAYIFDDSAGEGITAFVVDTGIRVSHSEFEGRATFGGNFVDDVVRFPLSPSARTNSGQCLLTTSHLGRRPERPREPRCRNYWRQDFRRGQEGQPGRCQGPGCRWRRHQLRRHCRHAVW